LNSGLKLKYRKQIINFAMSQFIVKNHKFNWAEYK